MTTDTQLIDYIEQQNITVRYLPDAQLFGLSSWVAELPNKAVACGDSWREVAIIAYELKDETPAPAKVRGFR